MRQKSLTLCPDDIIVFSRTLDEHLYQLKLVILRQLENKLKLNPTKCKFIRQEVDYLGHVLTTEGVKTSEEL